MTGITKTTEYKKFLREIKARIQTAQIKAAIKVNVELLRLYWDLAQMIVRKQKQSAWGDGLIFHPPSPFLITHFRNLPLPEVFANGNSQSI